MGATMKVRRRGGSLVVTLPKEVVRELGVRAGDALDLIQVKPGEFRLSRHDPETVAALKAHKRIVAEYRDAFRDLAQ